LERWGGERAIEALTEFLKDEDSDVRRAAAVALGDTGDKRAVEPLIQAAGFRGKVSEAAVYALGRIKDARAVERLISILQEGPRVNSYKNVTEQRLFTHLEMLPG
jgi:HEAT repeat protein